MAFLTIGFSTKHCEVDKVSSVLIISNCNEIRLEASIQRAD